MKKTQLIFSSLFLALAVLFSTISFAQTTNCPKAGTPDCPLIKKCPKKGSTDCPYVAKATKAEQKVSKELANCPLAGTPDCPLIKNCPKKGTTNCPYTHANSATASVASTKQKDDSELPPCCRKK